ncbi:methyltransferase-like protein 9 [Melanaphis sacchari]|uniref:Methyltransferase-like protein 9 n=1 Tax=Melanaphis sacchari TaxID=742174 RepID=A0A2H8TID1_9HEMI|nr:methyltransferase-like protein 9 [Melanaphis sacchari]XP_025209171.1 methyltransferase-like protein 9 [Melanaphis sacchari]XP_025209172.1 methyltransferase-like protein 9 [Melanaphis sacchari]
MNTYHRRGLAKVIAEKALLSQSLKNLNKAAWYSVDKSQLDNDVSLSFVQMHADADTERFLDDSIEQSDRLFMQVWKSLASTVLNMFMTKTSINGLLRRGSMFVFSTDQIRRLLNLTFFDSGSTLIDLGAGDGATTEKYTPLIREVYTTEKSGPMIRILTEKGFRLLDVDTWWTREEKFDVVSCLNLLDRCSNPAKLLQEMKNAVKPNGRIIVALVLPYKPFDEFRSAIPEQKLPITGVTFEEQVCSAVHDVFEPSGLEVLRWTKLPYLCEGDLSQDYYWLYDAVFVMSAKTPPQVIEDS